MNPIIIALRKPQSAPVETQNKLASFLQLLAWALARLASGGLLGKEV